jgi:hypothetical protein
MKKEIFILLVLLLLPLTTAAGIEMNDNFSKGETFIANIFGNFVKPLSKDNVRFYRGHVQTNIVFELTKFEGEYYIYASLKNKEANNYTIKVVDAIYMDGLDQKTDDIEKTFTIGEETADFSVIPGFVETSGEFSLTIQNLRSEKINVSVFTDDSSGGGFWEALFGTTGENEDIFPLRSGEEELLSFKIEPEATAGVKYITLKSENTTYDVPIYVYKEELPEFEEESVGFEFDLPSYEINMDQSSNRDYPARLYNTGKKVLRDVNISLSGDITEYIVIYDTNIERLRTESSEGINLVVASGGIDETIKGKIIATWGDYQTESDIKLIIEEGYDSEEDDAPTFLSVSCSDAGGEICHKKRVCAGKELQTKDSSSCCLEGCVKPTSFPWGVVIGILLITIIIAAGIYFYFVKYKGVRNPISFIRKKKVSSLPQKRFP